MENSPRFTAGVHGARATLPGLGFSMALGTLEGPGPLEPVRGGLLAIAGLRQRRQLRRERLLGERGALAANPRLVGCELYRRIHGRLYGQLPWRELGRLRVPDPTVRWAYTAWKAGLPEGRS